MICITNAKTVLEDRVLEDSSVCIEDGVIKYVGTERPEGDFETVDAAGLYLCPGLIDIHVHGGNGDFFFNDPEGTAGYFLRNGETTVLAALYYNMSKQGFLDAIDLVRGQMSEGRCPNLIGFYMEGPYMNPKYGALAEKNLWKGEIRPEDYREIVDRAGDVAKVWVVAAEREGVPEFVKYAKRVNPSAVISVGASEADPDQVESLKGLGLRLQTHCMNATGRITEWSGTRGCGPDEACLLDDDIYAEIISDTYAIHVNRHMLNLVMKVKGPDRIVLITDNFASNEPSPEKYRYITDLAFDPNGNLNGSRLTLNVACRNMMRHTGCSLPEVFRMGSLNPAKVLGIDGEKGSVKEGKRADLILADGDLNVRKVYINGRAVL